MFMRQISCSQSAVAASGDQIFTEFILYFLGWNARSIHMCQCSYKKICWVRVSVSGCFTDGGCSILCSQIQNDMVWKICLKLYIQQTKRTGYFTLSRSAAEACLTWSEPWWRRTFIMVEVWKLPIEDIGITWVKSKGGRRGEQNQTWVLKSFIYEWVTLESK